MLNSCYRLRVIENPKSPQIRKAAALLRKKERLAVGKFLVEGPHAVAEALISGAPVQVIYATAAGRSRHPEIDRAADKAGVRIELVTPEVLAKLCDTVSPQGVVAVVAIAPQPDLSFLFAQAQLVAVLLDVQDPGNAGTVLRAADAAGADAVIFAGDSIDPWHPKVVRATTGSLFHIPVLSGCDFAEVVQAAHAAGVTSIATDLQGADIGPDDALLQQRICWVFGNEARGMSKDAVSLCGQARKLPIFGAAESLNLATAAAVCLYTTAFAQRAALA